MMRILRYDVYVRAVIGDLRVWWWRENAGIEKHTVATVDDAMAKLDKLAAADLANDTVSANTGGLEVYNGSEWEEWEDENGFDISDVVNARDEQRHEAEEDGGAHMNVWLDDFRRPGENDISYEWTGWGEWNVWVRDARSAIMLVRTGLVKTISLDHDLGADGTKTGYDVACEIERLAHNGTLPRMKVYVHSTNTVGAEKMRVAIKKAEEAWDSEVLK